MSTPTPNEPSLSDWLSAIATAFAFFSSVASAWIASKSLRAQSDQNSAYKSVNVGIYDIKIENAEDEKGIEVLEVLICLKNFGQTPIYFKIKERLLLLNGIKINSDFNGTNNRVLMPSHELCFVFRKHKWDL